MTALTAAAIAELTVFAGRLADRAGDAILPHFRNLAAVDDKSAAGQRYDPVTVADRAAETAMRALIAKTYPTHGIFGEEHGHSTGASPLTWVLDPIDGTRAFITGLPLWGVLIALNDGTAPVIGIMDQPFTGERFLGTPDGASLNGAPLRCRPCPTLDGARLMTTGPDLFPSAADLAAFDRVRARAQLTRFGGDCYAYAMVAAGHVDAVIEAGLKPYDIQALIPIVQGAGGIVTDWQGGDAQQGGRVLACGDRRLHAEIISVLAP